MKTIKQAEANQASGGLTCIDLDTYKEIQDTAIHEGFLLAGFSAVIFGSFIWGVANSLTVGALSAFAVAPYFGMHAYFQSSQRDFFDS